MTIAIGMLCHGGAILAVDGRATDLDGTVTRGRKLCVVNNAQGISFGIATAADNLNAAETVVREISTRIIGKAKTIKKWAQVERCIKEKMTEWARAYGQNPFPRTNLIAGITIAGQGTRLYFCEPPNTVLPNKDGYIAVGTGAAVTDPLFTAFFTPLFASSGPQYVCRGLCYLMYRAKKDNMYCGGPTDAVYLDTHKASAIWLNGNDFRDAESASFQLDLILQATTTAALTDAGPFLKNNASGIENLIVQCERLRETVFRAAGGKAIGK
ncbi:MAG TPA: hypothetical protein VNJ52_05115 [Patescibacteria group bacterium]|nr:hypothetical protein [Patescibacteria group bacterium]